MKSNAIFSSDRKYRFVLSRIWDESKPMVQFIGLNPSTANEETNDATVRRCINFAKFWNYGGMYMTNLYAYVSTDPNKLLTSGEDFKRNNEMLIKTSKLSRIVIFSWGCFTKHKNRMDEVIEMFPEAYCIAKSKHNFPKHPLYLKSNLTPIKFK